MTQERFLALAQNLLGQVETSRLTDEEFINTCAEIADLFESARAAKDEELRNNELDADE